MVLVVTRVPQGSSQVATPAPTQLLAGWVGEL